MGQTKTSKVQTAYKLPIVARRLIEENKQRRICGADGGNFLGQLDKTLSYLRWKTACNTLSDAIGYH